VELKSFADMDCSVAQCLEAVGDRWSLLVVRDCFLGVRRFDDFQRRLGISRNILHQRLEHLVGIDVLSRSPYQDRPERFEYRLTDRGRDLWPVISAMREWGDKYAAPTGPPVEVVHRDCGGRVALEFDCSTCGATVGMGDVKVIGGTGRPNPLVSPKPRSLTRAPS
jgi:DNA-binding HxlR family transcriptional regulator